MTNQVTAHNVRPVNTTVGELEPGTIYRVEGCHYWRIRSDEYDATSMTPGDGMLCYGDPCHIVVEIADSVTITKEVTSA